VAHFWHCGFQEIRRACALTQARPRLLFLPFDAEINPQLQKARKPNDKFEYHHFLSFKFAGNRGQPVCPLLIFGDRVVVTGYALDAIDFGIIPPIASPKN
jgi:hypothetical protein